MSDKYPRVTHNGAWTGWPAADLRALSDGVYKVVPADAIVIERSELPEVVERPGEIKAGRSAISLATIDGVPTLARSERRAVEEVAILAYLREHPPVDEREVEALRRLVCDADEEAGALGPIDYTARVVRALLATGKVHVDVEAER